ncbi:hypothetical protein E1180_04800 [Roseibium denhamense]|nr:hypothetical protein [Roseibium denhamense]
MRVPPSLQTEYQAFLSESGFDNPCPQSLLMELASLSMDVYLKEISWLSDFIGRVQKIKTAAA